LTCGQAVAWAEQVCDALTYLHSQNPPLIHGDIKPAKIRIDPAGDAVLVDFSLSRILKIPRQITPHFAAPELYGSSGPDARSDLYALGVTLYCMLAYRIPPISVDIMAGTSKAPPPVKVINQNVTDAVNSALHRAMQLRRAGRQRTLAEFKSALTAEEKAIPQAEPARPTAATRQPVMISEDRLILSNGMEFVRVPAGKFLMGSTKSNDLANDNERPQHKVDINFDYWMGRHLITNEMYESYVRANGLKHPVEKWEEKRDHPVVYVKWQDALAYCKWLNASLKNELPANMILRLPTEAEWEKAARGADGREYPWGNDFDEGKFNASEAGKGSTTPVGKFSPDGDSPCGCTDMIGNVREWTHSLKKDYPYAAGDGREDEETAGRRVFRGGSYIGSGQGSRCAFRSGFGLEFAGSGLGFRAVISKRLL
jgi:formylglycine-generating enzyme required for sulfatase activity